MTKKSLTNKANDSVNHLAKQNLPTEMVELSNEALSQVWRGWKNSDNFPVLPPLKGRPYIIWNPPYSGISTPPHPVPSPHAP